jgi:hypothetical protein
MRSEEEIRSELDALRRLITPETPQEKYYKRTGMVEFGEWVLSNDLDEDGEPILNDKGEK